ncbi:MAG: TIGR03545 family protein [Calditrichaceae bacterium]|nr:TIGR03545 family protein [Calditrichaceae bacterium]MBN2710593.1 TIGR03545 family protein [Calditrichaceae bacterium]RQV94783.1 MAG: TIGR03545 family protein [Calditrichota bacterium]
MIRWAGVITIVVLAAIIFVLGLIFTDEWLEGKLEDMGSSIVGAKVEIDDLEIGLLELKFQWQRIQVTDPKHTMKNMFETGVSTFDLEFWPLFTSKYIIESFDITNFRTFTDRETDGKIEKEPEPPSEPGFISKTIDNLSSQVSENVNLNLDEMRQSFSNVDNIMATLDIRSGKKIDSLKNVIESGYKEWDTKFKNLTIEQDIKSIEAKAKTIKLDKGQNLAQIQQSLATANEIVKDVEKLNNQVKDIRTNLTDDIKGVQQSVKQVDDWIKEDYARAKDKAKLPDFSVQNIGKLLFGPNIVGRVNQALGYAAKARYYASKMKSDKPEKKPDPPRFKGQDIYFPSPLNRPKFWIRSLSLTGATNDGLQLEGKAADIVSNQKMIGRPTTIDLNGGREGGTSIKFTSELNYLEETPKETFNLDYNRISLNHTKLSDSPVFPTELEKGVGNVQAGLALVGETIDGKINFTGSDVVYSFKEPKSGNDLYRLIRDAIKNINRIEINALISGQRDQLKFRLNSNLDKAIADNVKAVIGAEVEKVKRQVEERIRKEVDKYKSQLDSMIKEKEAKLRAEVAKYEEMVNKEKEKIEAKKKEIEKKIEDEKKKLEKGVSDKIKGIFK